MRHPKRFATLVLLGCSLALTACETSSRPATEQEVRDARQGAPADPPPDQFGDIQRDRQRGGGRIR